MPPNANELIIAPGGAIYVAPVGAAEPADESAALAAAWIDLGYVTEDGVAIRPALSVAGMRAWQSAYDVRRLVQSRGLSLGFSLEQWNKVNLPLSFGGGTVSQVSAGKFKYTPPAATAGEDQRAMLVEYTDGAKKYRWIFRKVALASIDEITLQRTALGTLPLSFDVLGSDAADPFIILTNDPALTP